MPFVADDLIKSMLFNEKYSDLMFALDDGTKIHAHQMVVYERCEYFKYVEKTTGKYWKFPSYQST